MSIYIPETNEIYFAKTKEYFKEVLSSYSNGNYRSAVVMLYSTVIGDILLKLKELKDMYNDAAAIRILKEIEDEQKESKSKSTWEKDLLEKIRDKTNLIDSKVYSDLSFLYADRCFSAHPAVNEDFELYTPNQETVIAHIKNALQGVLIKPPIFIKNVIDMLTNELKEKKDIYLNNKEELDVYLKNKYYSHMNDSMKIKVFRTLWRFCFRNTDNEDCKNNRKINRLALHILANTCLGIITTEIKNKPEDFTVAIDNDCLGQLTVFLSSNSSIYSLLSQDVKLSLEKFIDDNGHAKWGAWFRFTTLKKHIDYLKKKSYTLKKSNKDVEYMYGYYVKNGKKEFVLDFFVYYYINSYNFSDADERYNLAIQPYLKEFTFTQIHELIKGIDGNRQVFDRNAAYRTNTEIIKSREIDEFQGFNFEQYSNFKFDTSVLTTEQTQESVDDFILPF